MAKAKAALAPKKGAAKKPAPSPLAKPGKKSYTKGQLIAHLATAVSGHGLGDVSKKQAAAFVEELTNTMFNFAPVGAVLPGLGKLVLRQIPAKPARTIVSFGKEIKVGPKPKSQKLVFRFSKDAKARYSK
jgi:nucleoid DNA-binding protein